MLLRCRISETNQIEEEVKFQSYMLSFLFLFFTGKQYMKTSIKVSIKVKRIIWALSRCQSRRTIIFKCILFGESFFDFFWQKGNLMFMTLIHIHTACFIILPKKIPYFWVKQELIFPDGTKKIIFKFYFLENPCFKNIWQKYHISMYFFEKNGLWFSEEKWSLIFWRN